MYVEHHEMIKCFSISSLIIGSEDTGQDSDSGVGPHDEYIALFNQEENRDSDQSELDELIEELDEKSGESFFQDLCSTLHACE